jgi:hypothetical protein
MYGPACFNAYSSQFTPSMPLMPLAEICVIYEIFDWLFAALVSFRCPPLDTRLPIVASSTIRTNLFLMRG